MQDLRRHRNRRALTLLTEHHESPMTEIENPTKVKPGRHYLRRNGGWFREHAKGYTNDISEAGTFDAEVAKSHMMAEGVRAVRVEDMANRVYKEMQESLAKTAKLAGLFERLSRS